MITEQVTCLNLKIYSTSAAEPCSSLVKATAPKQKMTQENDMSPYDHSDHEQLVSALDRFLGQQVLSSVGARGGASGSDPWQHVCLSVASHI